MNEKSTLAQLSWDDIREEYNAREYHLVRLYEKHVEAVWHREDLKEKLNAAVLRQKWTQREKKAKKGR